MTATRPDHQDHDAAQTDLEAAVSRLFEDARDVRAATAVLGDRAPGEQRYADEVATALATLEFDLRAAEAALAARRADTSDDLRTSISEVEEAARTWLDDLSVQARLGRMELRDRAESVAKRLERARGEAQRAIGRVADSVESDLDEMRRVTLTGIREVRGALTDAVAALRNLDD